MIFAMIYMFVPFSTLHSSSNTLDVRSNISKVHESAGFLYMEVHFIAGGTECRKKRQTADWHHNL